MIWEEIPLQRIRLRGLRSIFGWLTFIVAVVLFSLTSVVASSWLCGLALFMMLLTVAICSRGSQGRFSLLGVSGIFLLLLPLPLNYDLLLIQWLQGWTSRQSGQVLEVFGVWHLMRGNLLLLENKTFFIEEACAGVHSFFALVSAAAIFSVWTQRGVVSSVFLILLTVPWALLTNVIRICTVTMGWYLFQINLAEGWKHELLGAALFVCACLLCWSTALLARFFISLSAVEKWKRDLSFGKSSEALADSRSNEIETASETRPGMFWFCAFSALAVALAVVNLVRSPYLKIHYNEQFVQNLNRAFGEDTLVAHLRPDLSVSGYEAKDRELMSSWGKHSRVWKLSASGWAGELSVDYLWQHQHDLTWCYGGAGWNILSEEVSTVDSAWPLVTLQLSRLSGEKAVVLYSLLDTDGDMFFSPTRRTIGSEVAGRVRFEVNRFAKFKDGVIQIQMFVPNVEANDPSMPTIISDYRNLREVVRVRVKETAEGSSTP